jgi:hypothetical protein
MWEDVTVLVETSELMRVELDTEDDVTEPNVTEESVIELESSVVEATVE